MSFYSSTPRSVRPRPSNARHRNSGPWSSRVSVREARPGPLRPAVDTSNRSAGLTYEPNESLYDRELDLAPVNLEYEGQENCDGHGDCGATFSELSEFHSGSMEAGNE